METKDWGDMRLWMGSLLERNTGAGVAEWNERVAATGIGTEPALREWLDGQGVHGYGQMLLVYERFGYPDFFTATADELVDAQYAGRPALREVYERVVLAATAAGDVRVQARKTYVSLLTPRRTFAIVQATTKSRVDLGLRLDGVSPGGRLAAAPSLGNDTINVRVPLASPDEVDDEVAELLRRAYDASA